MIGGVLQLAVQIPALRRVGMLPHIALGWSRVRRCVAAPGRADASCGRWRRRCSASRSRRLSILINTQIASHQGVGAVSWLDYADRLMEFPTALLGVALGVVLIPQLSAAQAGAATPPRTRRMLDWGLRLALAAGAAVRARRCSSFPSALIATLFERGAVRCARRRARRRLR